MKLSQKLFAAAALLTTSAFSNSDDNIPNEIYADTAGNFKAMVTEFCDEAENSDLINSEHLNACDEMREHIAKIDTTITSSEQTMNDKIGKLQEAHFGELEKCENERQGLVDAYYDKKEEMSSLQSWWQTRNESETFFKPTDIELGACLVKVRRDLKSAISGEKHSHRERVSDANNLMLDPAQYVLIKKNPDTRIGVMLAY